MIPVSAPYNAPMTANHPADPSGRRVAAPFGSPDPVPVVAHGTVTLSAAERQRIARVARRLRRAEPNLAELPGDDVAPGAAAGPRLIVEDHSAIRLFEQAGDEAYSYRALLLAGRGDRVAIGIHRCEAFERYCRERLGLGAAEVLAPRAGPGALARRCTADPRFLGRVAPWARAAGGLTLLPYMATAGVWRLAAAIATHAGVPVRVAGPPPGLCRRVNDKVWFSSGAVELLGHRAVAPGWPVFGSAALAARLRLLADSHRCVAVKLPDSASSAGNLVLDAAEVRTLAPGALEQRLLALLDRAGWDGGYPLLVSAWRRAVQSTPSVHLWIPEPVGGMPVVEGIFEQRVAGEASAFVGAEPSALPAAWQERLVREALMLGSLYQDLGYYGRCSFDAILAGPELRGADLYWVECNGRWGGVSMPMTLANRLWGDWARRPLVIAERADLRGGAQDFDRILQELEPRLWSADRPGGGAVLLSPGRIAAGSGFELMVTAPDREQARAEAAALGDWFAERLQAGAGARS